MNHFEITGWTMPTLAAASEKALLLLKDLSESSSGFAVEAHCQSLDVLKRVADAAPSDRCACYCWKPITNGEEFNEESFSTLRRAYVVFDGAIVSINAFEKLPPYDWDGHPPSYSDVSFTTLHPAPLKQEDKEPSPETIGLLAELGVETIGEALQPVKTSTSWKESRREHSYLLKAPRDKSSSLVSKICSRFALREGIGSFEFLGTPDELATILQSQKFRFESFPSTCWNLNYPADTAFSFGVSAFLSPVPHVQPEQLLPTALIIDELGEKVHYRSVVKKYLAWKLSDGTFSRRVQGNYLLISRQESGGYVILLGFERYEDKDPSSRNFSSFASPLLERIGAYLKKVSGPR